MSKVFKLVELAHARSGDKGSMVNIGVIAYNEKNYDFLKEELTEERVFKHFIHLNPRSVKRYELPNLWAFNFLLVNVLGKGGSLSLRCDAQGKALGQALLEIELKKESYE